MARLGPRSGGCYACIKRKVRCDEDKPSCSRCLKRKQPCPGYRDRHELVFRHVNTPTVPNPRSEASARCCSSIELEGPKMKIDLEHYAISYFIANYTLPATNERSGYFDFIPDLLRHSTSHVLKYSILAISVASLIKNRNSIETTLKSREYYVAALISLRLAIKDKSQLDDDAVLAAVMLLSRFEILMGEKTSEIDAHTQAEQTLIHRRQSSNSHTPYLREMTRIVDREKILVSLCGFDRSQPADQTPSTLEYKLSVPIGDFECVLHITNHVCGTLRRFLIHARKEDIQTARLYLDAALSLERRTHNWVSCLDNRLQYKTVRCAGFSSRYRLGEFQLLNAHIFPDILHAGRWTAFWCARLMLLKTIPECLSVFQPIGAPTLKRFRGLNWNLAACSVADDICAASPYLLGEIDANGDETQPELRCSIIGPQILSLSLYASGYNVALSKAQRDWIVDQLEFIGLRKGIRQALVFRDKLLGSMT